MPQGVSPLLTQLYDRLEGYEGLEIEFKSARGGLPKSLWPTVSAFANTSGGWILLGFAEDGGLPVAVGVSNPRKLIQEFHDAVRSSQKISHPVCGPADASQEDSDGKTIIIIRVPAAPRHRRR